MTAPVLRKAPLKDSIAKAIERTKIESMRLQRERPIWPKEFAQDTPECALRFLLNLRTWDESAKRIRQFPNRAYLRRFVLDWWTCKSQGRTLYIRKCRRMVISWACRGLELWAMGLERMDQMLGGEDYEAAAKHCWRYKHYYVDLQERFPSWNLPPHFQIVYEGDRMLKTFGLSNGSRCTIVNAKSKTIQGEGTSIITFEELGLYDDPGGVVAQAKIVTQGDSSTGQPDGFVCCITNLTTNPKLRRFEEKKKGVVQKHNITIADENHDAAWLERTRQKMALVPYEFRLQILMIMDGGGGALWGYDIIDQFRLPGIPASAKIQKTVVAIDPSVTDRAKVKDPKKEPDACGISVVSLDTDEHAYVRFDLSDILSPAEIVHRVIKICTMIGADEIIYEENQGKHWIPALFEAYGCRFPLRGVVATEGKRTRAEPTVIPYELGRVHHIGYLTELEVEQTTWDSTNPSVPSPNRLDALVHALVGVGLCVSFEPSVIDSWIDSVSEQVF